MKYTDEVEIHLSGVDVSDERRITKCVILGRVKHFDHHEATVSFERLVGEWEIRAPRDWFRRLSADKWLLDLV